MRSNALIALTLSAALLLAGCASEEAADGAVVDDTPDNDGGNETADPDAGNETADPDTGGEADDGNETTDANTPPTAELIANVTNGTAPLNVTFTLDGSDADGDDLTWTLRTDQAELATGDALPASVDHEFAQGSYNVTLEVTDGNDTTLAHVLVEVTEAAPGTSLQATWTGTIYDPTCLVQDGHSVPEAYWGMEYRVVEGWSDGMFMDFWDAAIENSVGTSDEAVGTIPPDAGNAWLCMGDSTALLVDYAIEIWG